MHDREGAVDGHESQGQVGLTSDRSCQTHASPGDSLSRARSRLGCGVLRIPRPGRHGHAGPRLQAAPLGGSRPRPAG